MDYTKCFIKAIVTKDLGKVSALLKVVDINSTEIYSHIRNFNPENNKAVEIFRLVMLDSRIDLSINNDRLINMYVDTLMGSKIKRTLISNVYNELLKRLGHKSISIDSHYDIEDIYNVCIEDAINQVIQPVKHVYDPMSMIKSGFMPLSNNSKFYIALEDYIAGTDLETIRFWVPTMAVFIENLKTYPIWEYRTIESYRRNGIEKSISLPLILYAPEFIYKISKRPVTDMSLFRGPMSKKISKYDIVKSTINLDGIIWNVIPVSRYASGMSKGLFFDSGDAQKEYCGTFYYYEPESTTYLAYKTKRIFFNKYDCQLTLGDNHLAEFDTNKIFMAYYQGKLPRDLIMTPDQAAVILDRPKPNLSNSRPRYAGIYLGLNKMDMIY
jgi:hypothetical protein